jgi:signal transduction histidine kinase/ActR/RegA family two-component response regulator
MKIMIVEDDPVSMALLKKALAKMEEEVVTATTGTEAQALFQAQQPRIVISDWMMPEMNGLELCREIRSQNSNTYTYVILTTGKDKQEDLLEAFNAGIDDYLTKPFDIREFLARLNTGKRMIELEDNYKYLQEILIQSRNKIRTVFDVLPEEILTVDLDLNIMAMNRSMMEKMSGSFEDYHDTPCHALTEDGDSKFYAEHIKEMVQACVDTGAQHFHLDRYIGSSVREVIKERTALPIKDDEGRVFQVTFVSRDVTEAYQHQEEMKKLNRKLKIVSSELINKNGKLENALENLERTQAQMLQSEKMASIGQLAAGVAHEINNPTGFVSSNLKTLGDYLTDLNQLLGDYQALKENLDALPDDLLPAESKALLKKVATTETEIDIDYIKEDTGMLIEESCEGTERIKKIVDDLKQFAHPGEEKMKATDINAGLESTLNVVNNELKYKATIVKAFGDLPIISAHPQQLNQVFMNILVNAAQAIEKSGQIKIVTATVDGKAEIRISDTGCGISEKNLSKIFDPFFTTKDVGKGTGLGMNIAYNIIRKHEGEIRVESEIGKGTTFIIQLPPGRAESEAPPDTQDAAMTA